MRAANAKRSRGRHAHRQQLESLGTGTETGTRSPVGDENASAISSFGWMSPARPASLAESDCAECRRLAVATQPVRSRIPEHSI